MSEVVIEESKVDIVEKIKIARSKDEEVVRIVEEIKKVGVKVLRRNKWQIKVDLVLKESKVYVLKDKELEGEIMWLHYNVPVAGHKGR